MIDFNSSSEEDVGIAERVKQRRERRKRILAKKCNDDDQTIISFSQKKQRRVIHLSDDDDDDTKISVMFSETDESRKIHTSNNNGDGWGSSTSMKDSLDGLVEAGENEEDKGWGSQKRSITNNNGGGGWGSSTSMKDSLDELEQAEENKEDKGWGSQKRSTSNSNGGGGWESSTSMKDSCDGLVEAKENEEGKAWGSQKRSTSNNNGGGGWGSSTNSPNGLVEAEENEENKGWGSQKRSTSNNNGGGGWGSQKRSTSNSNGGGGWGPSTNSPNGLVEAKENEEGKAWGSQKRSTSNNNGGGGWGSQKRSTSNSNGGGGWGSSTNSPKRLVEAEENEENKGWGSQKRSTSNNNGGGGWESSTSMKDSCDGLTEKDGQWTGRLRSCKKNDNVHTTGCSHRVITPEKKDTINSTVRVLYRTLPPKEKFCNSKFLVKSEEPLSVYRESSDEFFLRYKFKGDLVVVEIRATVEETLETEKVIGYENYVLICVKYQKNETSQKASFFGDKLAGAHIKAFYLKAKSIEGVKKKLLAIADFSSLALNPGKLASRLELLVSPAARSNVAGKVHYQFNLDLSMFETLHTPENQTMGCGFIPVQLLRDLLGNKLAIGVQVRVISSHLGVYKGLLVAKQGIDKIQLPDSMKKVGKSKKKASNNEVYVVFTQTFPSQACEQHERHINPNIQRAPTKAAKKDLKKLSETLITLLMGCGIPEEMIRDYNQFQTHEGYNHRSVIGVSDCTGNSLPEGKVFLTGFGVGGRKKRRVIVTRSPCTDPSDLHVLELVSNKPKNMTKEDWQHICSLPFGAIMFASPQDPHAKSLPEIVNSSDLDGDFFCCIWDENLVANINPSQCAVDTEDNEKEEEEDENIGTEIPLKIDGKSHTGIIHKKLNNGDYLVKAGNIEKIITYDELINGEIVEVKEVLGHRGKDRRADLHILWGNGEKSWEKLATMKNGIPDRIADYALRKGLTNEKEWRWALDYQRDAVIVKLHNHRTTKNSVEFEVYYDGEDKPEWVDIDDVDGSFLEQYVKGKGKVLNSSPKWRKIVKKRIEEDKKEWFESLQNFLTNVQEMVLRNRLTTTLYTKFEKSAKKYGIENEDTRALGNAYKESLDIAKHGGRVILPRHLREVVVSKTTAPMNALIQNK